MRRRGESPAAPRSYALLDRLLRSRIYRAAYIIHRGILIAKVAILLAALALFVFVKLVIGDAHARRVQARPLPVLPSAALALALMLAGCGARPVEDSSTDQPAMGGTVQPDAAQQQHEAYVECITRSLNEAVLKSQNVQATYDSMMAQTLNGCPTDFTQGFIDLRQAVRDYADTLEAIAAHNRDRDPAVNRDLLNLACSVFSGQQCAQSSVQTWLGEDDALKARDAENRATIQSRYDALEKIAAGYGVTISTPATGAPSDADTRKM